MTAGSGPTSSPYVLDNSAPQAAARFTSLEALFDPITFRHLDAIGIRPGWRCLEVGAGGGSVAGRLAERAGPTGHVLATDLDPRPMAGTHLAGVEVRRHDITKDPLPAAYFDLVHARLVLIHLPARQAALTSMVAALKPGGHLLIEDFDVTCLPLCPQAEDRDDALLNTVSGAFLALLAARGADLGYGGRLPRLLRTAGLTDVRAEGHVAIGSASSPVADLYRANIEQTRDQLIDAGLLTGRQIEDFYRRLEDPNLTLMLHVFVSATGRRR